MRSLSCLMTVCRDGGGQGTLPLRDRSASVALRAVGHSEQGMQGTRAAAEERGEGSRRRAAPWLRPAAAA